MRKNTLNQASPNQPLAQDTLPRGGPHFSPLACSAGVRLLVAGGVSLLLWLAVFLAMSP